MPKGQASQSPLWVSNPDRGVDRIQPWECDSDGSWGGSCYIHSSVFPVWGGKRTLRSAVFFLGNWTQMPLLEPFPAALRQAAGPGSPLHLLLRNVSWCG